MPRVKLTKNFYLDEFTHSQTAARHGIDMHLAPGGVVYSNIVRLCHVILQPVRDAMGPVHISSGWRPHKLNKIIGGSAGSAHIYGLAADITVDGHTPLEVALWMRDNIEGYDKLIHEFGEWVHVAVPSHISDAGKINLTAVKVQRVIPLMKPKTVYVPGILAVDDVLRQVSSSTRAA